jgi:hypothetical protein
MFNITVDSITKPIAVKCCPFCGGTKLQKLGYDGESEQYPTSECFQCEHCSLFFSVGDVDAEAFQYIVYSNNRRPLTVKDREQEFLKSFNNGLWIGVENY